MSSSPPNLMLRRLTCRRRLHAFWFSSLTFGVGLSSASSTCAWLSNTCHAAAVTVSTCPSETCRFSPPWQLRAAFRRLFFSLIAARGFPPRCRLVILHGCRPPWVLRCRTLADFCIHVHVLETDSQAQWYCLARVWSFGISVFKIRRVEPNQCSASGWSCPSPAA